MGDFARLRARHVTPLDQPEGYVFPDRQGVEQGRALKQHAEFGHQASTRRRAHVTGRFAVDLDSAGVSRHEAEQAFQQHRLTAARTANHNHRLRTANLKVDAPQNLFRAKTLG